MEKVIQVRNFSKAVEKVQQIIQKYNQFRKVKKRQGETRWGIGPWTAGSKSVTFEIKMSIYWFKIVIACGWNTYPTPSLYSAYVEVWGLPVDPLYFWQDMITAEREAKFVWHVFVPALAESLE